MVALGGHDSSRVFHPLSDFLLTGEEPEAPRRETGAICQRVRKLPQLQLTQGPSQPKTWLLLSSLPWVTLCSAWGGLRQHLGGGVVVRSRAPSRFQGSASQPPVGQPQCLPGRNPGGTLPPRICHLRPSRWPFPVQSSTPRLCLGWRGQVSLLQPKAWTHLELVHTVRIHPRAVRGHLGCVSCGWTMKALAPGRDLFIHQQM